MIYLTIIYHPLKTDYNYRIVPRCMQAEVQVPNKKLIHCKCSKLQTNSYNMIPLTTKKAKATMLVNIIDIKANNTLIYSQ